MAKFEETYPPYVRFGSRYLKLQSPFQRGSDVAILQSIYNLMLATMNPPQGPMGLPIPVTGIFGTATRAAVLNIQTYFGLTPDGVVGPQTGFVFGLGTGANVTYGGPVFGSRPLAEGMTGGDVTCLQNRLNCFRYAQALRYPADGQFGPRTQAAVKAFQGDANLNGDTGLHVTGQVDDATFDALFLYTFAGGRGIMTGRNGFDVVFVQVVLKNLGFYHGRITGYYNLATESAVKAFQAASRIVVDGVVGQKTFLQIGLRNPVPAPKPLGLAFP